MATTVAESRPPDSKMTARFSAVFSCSVISAPRLVIPKIFMQLQLQTHRQIVRHHPVRQITRVQVMVARREQDFAGTLVKTVLNQLGDSPVVVFPRADDKLHLIVRRKQLDVLVAV